VRYRAAVAACLGDDGVDGLLAILTPQAMTDADDVARAVVESARGSSKPLIACWMGEAHVAGARKILGDADIPTFRTPDPAVEMFAHVSAFYRNQQALLQTPGPLARGSAPDLRGARMIVDAALADRRKVLTEIESKALLASFHVPIARTAIARSAQEAVLLAEQFGFPVAMKIDSPDVTHKSDVGGVHLNVGDAQSVRSVYQDIIERAKRNRPGARMNGIAVEPMIVRPHGRELMVGVKRDAVFGPAITFGAGGTAVEVLRDRSVALPPLNAFLVAEMIRGTRVSKLLGAFRNLPPADMKALEAVLLRVSEMVCELPQVEELDVNPLIVDEEGAVVVDARVIVRDVPPMRRYAHMAIHPYPSELVTTWQPRDGPPITLRPIRPEDAEMEQAFVKGLSDQSRHFRFMNSLRELTPQMLARFTQIDYDRELAIIAVREADGREAELGVARYVTYPDGETCEFAIVVADAWQGSGLARRMLEMLIDVARSRGLKAIIGHMLSLNQRMIRLSEKLGFAISDAAGDPTTKRATLALDAAASRSRARPSSA